MRFRPMWTAAGLKGLDGAVTRGELPHADYREHRAGHVARERHGRDALHIVTAGHYPEVTEQQHPGSGAQRDREPLASNLQGGATDGAEPTRSASNSSGPETTGPGASTLLQPSRPILGRVPAGARGITPRHWRGTRQG